jgi:hypothetical protein
MSNKVKWMHQGMAGAPVLTNNWGSLTALLDACLVNGFNLKTVTALSRVGDIATATIGSGHGFMVDQVVSVEGCDQPPYNGEFTVISITSTTVSFRIEGEPESPATTQSTLTMKVAPLGLRIAFTGTNRRVYRSPNPLSNRHFLRVDDSLPEGYTATWAKFARVTLAEEMVDVDTFIGARAPYDPSSTTRNEVPSGSGTAMYAGWFKWYFARNSYNESSGDNGNWSRSWVLIGDDRGFFLTNSSGYGGDKRILHAFTDFDSYKPGDNFASYLIASERYRTVADTANNMPSEDARSAYAQDTTGKICLRDYTQIGGNVRLGMLSLNDGNNQNVSGHSGAIPFPNGPNYGLILHPIYLRESSGGHLRGRLPGMFWVHQNQPYPHLTMIENVVGYTGRKFLYVTMDYSNEGNTSGFLFDIAGPWRP